MGGKSERSLLAALVQIGRERSSIIPGGVRVSVSVRDLALKAATSTCSGLRILGRLREKRLVRRDDAGRSGTQFGAVVIVAQPARSLY